MFESRRVMTGAITVSRPEPIRFWAPPENTNAPDQVALWFKAWAVLLKCEMVTFSSSHRSKKVLKTGQFEAVALVMFRKWVFSALSRNGAKAMATTPGVACEGLGGLEAMRKGVDEPLQADADDPEPQSTITPSPQ